MVNGRAFKPADWGKEGLPIVRIQNLNDPSKPFNSFSGAYQDRHYIDDGDILLSWSGTPGTSFGCFRWLRGPALLNQHIFKVHVDPGKMDGDFFINAVNGRLEQMIGHAHGGVGLRHITKPKLEAMRLPFPSLEEQRRIVARIKECTERVDEIQALRAESLRAAAASLPALLSETFSLLQSYAPFPISDFALETRYGTSTKCSTEPMGIPILRIPNVAGGFVNFQGLKYCDLDTTELRKLLLQDGDLLFVRTNGSRDLVGRCAIFSNNSDYPQTAFASYLIRLRLDSARLLPEYVSYYLSSTQGRSDIDGYRRTSAGQFNINSENLKSIRLPVPPIEIQHDVANTLADRQALAMQLQDYLTDERAREAHLRESILRKAFAGEL